MWATRDKRAKGAEKEGGRLWIWAAYTDGEEYAIGIEKSGMTSELDSQLYEGLPVTEMPRRLTVRDIAPWELGH
jgi:hypothetical protein